MLLLNAGSIGNKMDELFNLVYSFSNRPAIIGISETWLSSNINDSELSINGQYTVFRSDRQTRGGGVCLLIMNSLKPRLCNELLSKNCEVVWAECNLLKCNLKICCYYRPPYRSSNTLPDLSHCIALASRSNSPDSKLLVIGDFNVNLLNQGHYLFDDLSDFSANHNLHQFVSQPTFYSPGINPSLIDHIYSNDPGLITKVANLSPIGGCHHSVIYCGLNIQPNKPKIVSRTIWQYSKANWDEANRQLSDYQPQNGDDINYAWDHFHTYYMEVMNQCIPLKLFKCKSKETPWLNEELRKLCRKKHSLFRKWKKSQKSSDYSKYKVVRNKLTNRLKYAKHSFFASLLENESPSKRFWGYCKTHSGQATIPDSIHYNGVCASSPTDIANTFSQFFAECFNHADASNTPIPQYNFSSTLSCFSCSSSDVLSLVHKLANNSAAGIDGITSRMLKNTATSICPTLCRLFNLSLTTGRVPDAWKVSRVIPIFKAGDPHAATNYRPISLQPICAKLLEKIIHRNILDHLANIDILTKRQFGFLPKSSTSDALITALHDWYGSIEDRKSIVMALFDLSKAFDRVPHHPLLRKLGAVGLTGPILSWLKSYLSNRSQLVSVHAVDSDPVPVISGVPQGSVLGPLLFLVYVNDLCFSNFSSNSSLVLYADDITLYKPLSHSSDLADFQADINTIHSWFVSNHLSANASKTKAMVISTKKNPYSDMQLYLDNQVIERVSSAKFLGILISDSLSWSLYIDHICKKARRIIGFIHRAFSSAPICTRRILYLAIVRPILEYGSVTWHPLNTTLTNRLEACQRFAARVILQSWNLSHEDLLQKSNLPLLSKRRDYATLCHLYKILHHLSSSPNPYNLEGLQRIHPPAFAP